MSCIVVYTFYDIRLLPLDNNLFHNHTIMTSIIRRIHDIYQDINLFRAIIISNEFMKKHGVSRRTVYNWIKSDEIEAKKERGKWHIFDDTDVPLDDTDAKQDGKDELIEQLRSENEYLREELSQTNGTIADMQQRHDTITMQLTRQLENQNRMLEDMRTRTLWTRVKVALGFSG